MKHFAQGGIYTAEMGQPPTDLQEPTTPPKKPAPKKPKKPEPKKPMKPAPRDSVFREGMSVPQDVDGGSVGMKKGGKVKGYAKGGSASSRADGIAIKGKTKGRFV